ncbi:MAG: lysophospholipid acyltransferase family protein [Opitutales bacterium]
MAEESNREIARSAKELKWHQRALLAVVVCVLKAWMRTIRMDADEAIRMLRAQPRVPSVVLFWHNRIFMAPEFYRRFGRGRGHRLAALVSASTDGAWAAGLMKRMGVLPVRGSPKRGRTESIRQLVRSLRAGYDIAVTPDGSRGPVYQLKPGAVSIALKSGAPVVLISFHFGGAWRLKSWDRFYIPYPFSRVRVLTEVVTPDELRAWGADPRVVAKRVEARLAGMTVDAT